MKKGIIATITAISGITAGATLTGKVMKKEIEKNKSMSDKHLTLFVMMSKWVELKQKGKCLKSYFEDKNYKKIAIYGMSYVGERLVEELKNSDVEIAYGIDKNASGIYTNINMVTPEENLERVDAIIVTPVFFFDEIEDELSKKIDCPIISLEDILYEM